MDAGIRLGMQRRLRELIEQGDMSLADEERISDAMRLAEFFYEHRHLTNKQAAERAFDELGVAFFGNKTTGCFARVLRPVQAHELAV